MQALPMAWDFAESNPLLDGQPTEMLTSATWVARAIEALPSGVGYAAQKDASSRSYNGILVSTDPPYYDNISYANLSDYFYVWLRRSLAAIYPDFLGTVVTPKTDELVADPIRHSDKETAARFFEAGFTDVFRRIRDDTPDAYPITVFYAFKQSETDEAGDHASTGWETLLEGMLNTGWAVTATWPTRTERGGRSRDIEANALASSVVLACRPRPADAGVTDRRGLINALREEFPEALRKLEQGKIAPVDLRAGSHRPRYGRLLPVRARQRTRRLSHAGPGRTLADQPSP